MTLYKQDADGVYFTSERRSGDVRIPNYVFDIWLPLLGAQCIGVYATYCRLEREGLVKGMSLNSLATICHMSKTTLSTFNNKLAKYGFIRATAPKGIKQLKHFTMEIVVLDPPTAVSAEAIQTERPKGYQVLTSWLLENPHGTEEYRGQYPPVPPEVPISTAKIESSNLNPTGKDLAPASAPPILDPLFAWVARTILEVDPAIAIVDKHLSGWAWSLVAKIVSAEKRRLNLFKLDPAQRETMAARMPQFLAFYAKECPNCDPPGDVARFAKWIARWFEVPESVTPSQHHPDPVCPKCHGSGYIDLITEKPGAQPRYLPLGEDISVFPQATLSVAPCQCKAVQP